VILISVFGALTLYIISSAAVLRLRRTAPQLERPYRAPGYPVTPIIAMLLSIVCLGSMAYFHPWLALIYVGIIVISLILFAVLVPRSAWTRFD